MENLRDLSYSAEERKEMNSSVLTEAPAYPYGLCLTVDTSTVEKLGISEAPGVGEKVMILAVGEIKSVNLDNTIKDDRRNFNFQIQITKMDLKQKEDEKDDIASKLYGDNKA